MSDLRVIVLPAASEGPTATAHLTDKAALSQRRSPQRALRSEGPLRPSESHLMPGESPLRSSEGRLTSAEGALALADGPLKVVCQLSWTVWS